MPDTFPKRATSTLAIEQFFGPGTNDPGAGAVVALFGPERPPLKLAVAVAERVRVALMQACPDRVPWQISGKDVDDQPRVGHDHLFFLPYCSNADGGIDRVLVWAREGLEADTQAALMTLADRGGWIARGGPRLRVELLELGDRPSLSALPRRLVGPARVWRSATPFVPPRYCKQSRDTPEQQLSRLAGQVLGRAPAIIERRDDEQGWADFVQRSGADKRGRPGAGGWTLHFDAPLIGPVVLGHDAHYGLGQFEAVLS